MSCSGGLAPGSSLTPLTACELVSGICQTLIAEGATDQDLLDVASGCIDDTTLLTQLMGGYNSPVTPSTSTAYDSTVGEGLNTLSGGSLGALELFGGPSVSSIGNTAIVGATSAGAAAANAATDAANAIKDALDRLTAWLKANWIWIVGILLAALLLIAWAYGGFRLGFLQG